jgi:hypothetical protein
MDDQTAVTMGRVDSFEVPCGHNIPDPSKIRATSDLTEGQYRVGVSFNPSNNPDVDAIKREAAALIDRVYQLQFQRTGVDARAAALAMTAFEDGAMWAVKAVTKPPR